MYFIHAHAVPPSPNNLLHVWKPATKYYTLNLKEIWESVARPQEINQFTVMPQVTEEIPTVDKLLRGLRPETPANNVEMQWFPNLLEPFPKAKLRLCLITLNILCREKKEPVYLYLYCSKYFSVKFNHCKNQ